MAWLYALGPVGSSLASPSPSPTTAPSVTSSGKHSQRPLSWHGWKRRPWIELLSGTISQPSTADRGAELWISSLLASHVNPSAPRASSSAPKTSGGSGLMSSASFGRFNPDGLFSKTSLDLFGSDCSDPSSVDWPPSGTMRRGICSALPRSAPPISVSGSSFSRDEYPTPSATPYGTSQNEGEVPHDRPTKGTLSLETWAKAWATPSARDGKGSFNGHSRGGQDLSENAQNWPTPVVPNGGRTTNTSSHREDGSKRQVILDAVVRHWPTPSTEQRHDYQRDHGNSEKPYPTLQGAAKSFHSSRRGPEISSCGPGCSPSHRRLNPLFVEWLMGWPIGWSSVRIGSGPAATEFTLWKQRMRSTLSQLVSAGSRSS